MLYRYQEIAIQRAFVYFCTANDERWWMMNESFMQQLIIQIRRKRVCKSIGIRICLTLSDSDNIRIRTPNTSLVTFHRLMHPLFIVPTWVCSQSSILFGSYCFTSLTSVLHNVFTNRVTQSTELAPSEAIGWCMWRGLIKTESSVVVVFVGNWQTFFWRRQWHSKFDVWYDRLYPECSTWLFVIWVGTMWAGFHVSKQRPRAPQHSLLYRVHMCSHQASCYTRRWVNWL